MQQQNLYLTSSLWAKKAHLNALDNKQRSALWYAADQSWYAGIELLLKQGTKVDLQDNSGFTPLSRGAHHGYNKINQWGQTRLISGVTSCAPTYAVGPQ